MGFQWQAVYWFRWSWTGWISSDCLGVSRDMEGMNSAPDRPASSMQRCVEHMEVDGMVSWKLTFLLQERVFC